MRDDQTNSLWSHLLGECMEGELQGEVLESIPSDMVTWEAWKNRHPETTVLNLDRTSKEYSREFYKDPSRFVVGFMLGDQAQHCTFRFLQKNPLVHVSDAKESVVLTFDEASTSARLYSRRVDGRELTFVARRGGEMKDKETGSSWDRATGLATAGPLAGRQLEARVAIVSYARTWQTFHPDSRAIEKATVRGGRDEEGGACAAEELFAGRADKPNILVILADDLGYADVGFHGCKDIPTPHLDRLAARSVRCTSGYVSHPFCSPTRAGLLTGRYQQRFGHENNPAWLPESTVAGLPLSETTLPQVLKGAGYVTGCVGKWHLGAHPRFHPNRRGFDHYFGLLGGGHVYLPGVRGGQEYTIPLDRNGEPEPLEGYLTETLGREASDFISENQQQPWFLYLAFNAPHTPLQNPERILDRVKHIDDELRRGYAGLVIGMDDAIGETLKTLEDTGQADRTLVFFFSDNGGPVAVAHSDNTPLRGAKGQLYEGGIRTPFLVSWPDQLKPREHHDPVSSLDVFATAASVAGASLPASLQLDGVDLMPYLRGEKQTPAHAQLFWRTGGGHSVAARRGDWKWIKIQNNPPQLFNLAEDISESRDLADEQSEIASAMEREVAVWQMALIPPLFESPRPAAKKAKSKAR